MPLTRFTGDLHHLYVSSIFRAKEMRDKIYARPIRVNKQLTNFIVILKFTTNIKKIRT